MEKLKNGKDVKMSEAHKQTKARGTEEESATLS